MAKRRIKPELNLQPELPQVLSEDFNLFYKPEAEPEIAGLKEFTASLDNFISDAGTKIVLSKELKQKEINSAQAEKDFIENKNKFRDAVKNGTIDKTANPYYIEKYKELSLNEFADNFIDKLGKAYKEKNVAKDTRDGAFNQFYKSELDKFIKENDLGFFSPLELEKGFFKETTSYRNILENTHRNSQLQEFEKDFNNKVDNRIYGIFEKFKDFDQSPLGDFDDGVDKYSFLASKIQKEVTELLGVGYDASDITDRILEGIETYVTTTTDFEYAKEIVENLPDFIQGGTDTIANIGKVKKKKEELTKLLLDNEEATLNNEIKLREAKDKKEFLSTYDFLTNQGDDFNIIEYRNDSSRTNTEIKAIDTFINDQKFDGGNSDSSVVMVEIGKLLEEGKYDEAEEFARQNYYKGNIRKSTFTTIITSDIPNYRNFKDKPVFGNIEFTETIKGLDALVASSSNYGDKLQAGQAKTYINTRMLRWYKENVKKYTVNGEFQSEAFETDFINHFRNIIEVMKTAKTPDGDFVFKALQFNETQSSGAVFNNLDETLKKMSDK